MAKVYNEKGEKMNVSQICEEIKQTITVEQATAIVRNIEEITDEPTTNYQRILAHAILDGYKAIDMTSEQGTRMRKLTGNLMTKYQKTTTAVTAEDNKSYKDLIAALYDKSNEE